tara:strand:+ start:67 stop:288 length:222 start_codon:yes stop_codon:yes gene_type:complete
MKLTTKKLKELIKEEMSNMDVDPYASNQEAPENVLGPKKDENGNLIYYRGEDGVLWPSPQSPNDKKVIMAPVA